MTTSIMTAKSELNQAMAHAKIAKAIIRAHIESARILMDADSLHALDETQMILESDAATIGVHLTSIKRMSFGSKRFAVMKK